MDVSTKHTSKFQNNTTFPIILPLVVSGVGINLKANRKKITYYLP